MNPEELKEVMRWVDFGWNDGMLGANYIQNLVNHGRNPPAERDEIVGARLRREVEQARKGGKV